MSENLTFKEAAISEPVPCCIHGVDLADIKPGSNVVVIGGGPIGMIIIQLAKISGAVEIVLIEPVESKRSLAYRLGATLALHPNSDLKAAIAQKGAYNIDSVIECVGSKSTMEMAIDLAGRCASVVLFGLTDPDTAISVLSYEVFRKELKIAASYINPYTMSRSVSLLESGMIDVKSIIAGIVPVDDIKIILTDPQSRKNGKIIVSFNS